jgi:putative transposase
LRRTHQGYGDTFYIDEVFVKILGQRHYLRRAGDQDGEVVDVFLQKRRDGKVAKRFFKRYCVKIKPSREKLLWTN